MKGKEKEREGKKENKEGKKETKKKERKKGVMVHYERKNIATKFPQSLWGPRWHLWNKRQGMRSWGWEKRGGHSTLP